MTTPNLSITVGGTPFTGWKDWLYKWGESPISIGYSRESGPGIADCERYFILRVESERTIYIAKSQRAKAHGAERGGLLAVALAVPKGFCIAGMSAYEALTWLYDTFVERCMTQRKDVYDKTYWEYNACIPERVLDDVVGLLPLKPARGPHRPMDPQGGQAMLTVPQEKLVALFEDPMYPELTPYSEALVAVDEHENLLTGMTIPRTVVWKLHVEGEQDYVIEVNGTKRTPKNGYVEVRDPKATIRCAGNRPAEQYDNDVKTFSIEGERGIREMSMVGVQLSETSESIAVSLQPAKPKTQRWYISFDDGKAAKAFREKPFFRLMISAGRELSIKKDGEDGLFVELRGEEIGMIQTLSSTNINTSPGGYEVTGLHAKGGKLIIDTRPLPPAAPQPQRGNDPAPHLTITLPARLLRKIARASQRVVISEDRDAENYLEVSCLTLFHESQDRSTYTADIPLCGDWGERRAKVRVHLDNGYIYRTRGAKTIKKQGTTVLSEGDLEPAPTATYIAHFLRAGGGCLIGCLLCLVVGAIGEHHLGPLLADKDSSNGERGGEIVVHDTVRIIEHDTIVVEMESAPVSTDQSGFSFETKMAQAKAELAKEGLTFEEVKTLHEEIIMSADAAKYKQADPTTYQSLIDYHDIVTWIVEGDTWKLDKVLFGSRKFHIALHHRENLSKIFREGTRTVNTDYSNRYLSFKSFQELDSIKQNQGTAVGHE